MNADLSIQDLKARFSILDAWAALGLEGQAGRCVRSPFRPEKRASFSVFAEGAKAKDHTTGETFDVIDFTAKALACDTRGALAWLRERAGGTAVPAPRPERKREEKRKAKPWPVLRTGSAEELAALATLRGLPVPAVRAAAERGFLHFAEQWRQQSWCTTDAARRCVELRRMDGEPWAAWGDVPERKSHAIGQKDWPVGLNESEPFPFVLMLEGVGDFLASFAVILEEDRTADVAPVALLGASVRLAPEVAARFAQKRVRIIGQEDDAGRRAVREWATALAAAGARVDAFSFAGITDGAGDPIKDLGDVFAKASAVSIRANPQLLEVCPR